MGARNVPDTKSDKKKTRQVTSTVLHTSRAQRLMKQNLEPTLWSMEQKAKPWYHAMLDSLCWVEKRNTTSAQQETQEITIHTNQLKLIGKFIFYISAKL